MPTFEENLYDAIKPMIAETLVWADQNAPAPARPYCVMRIQSVKLMNNDHSSDVDDFGIQKVTGDREFTLNIQRFQEYTPENVTTKLQAVADKLQLRSHIDRFLSKGLAAFDTHPVMDISGLLDTTQIEKRASLDIMMRYRSTQLDDVGLIDTVNITGKDDGVSSPEYTIIVTV